MTVVCLAAVLDDDVAMIFEDGDYFLVRGHHLVPQNPALGLVDHPARQTGVMAQTGPMQNAVRN